MMKHWALLTIVASGFFALSTGGCSPSLSRERYDRKLHRGVTKKHVMDQIGEPDGKPIQDIWIYSDQKRGIVVTLRFDKEGRLFEKNWQQMVPIEEANEKKKDSELPSTAPRD